MNWENRYPLNTFEGETKKEILALIEEAEKRGRENIINEMPDTLFFVNKAKKELIGEISDWLRDDRYYEKFHVLEFLKTLDKTSKGE